MESAQNKLGHYEILRAIGSGGMGEIFVARDPKLGRKVAIKKLPQRLVADRDTLIRFTQEARSASALNHPNIVTIHEVGADGDVPFIVMEFIDGSDLRALINSGALSVRRALDLAVQIADGLSAAHERGIVHRDLKPENIMVTRDGFAKILDFGLAKITSPTSESGVTLPLEAPGTVPGTILGTVGYMSPEQATGRLVDFRSDQFAFGAILYELVTGHPAFRGETAIDTLSQILHHEPPPITRTNSRAPAQLSGIVRRLLEKSPEDRYASTRDLAREFHQLRDRVIAEDSGMREPASRLSRRGMALGASAAIGVALAIGAGFYYSGDEAAPAAQPVMQTQVSSAAKYLAVVRFEDLTGDERGELVVDGFAETLSARLAGYPSIQVRRPTRKDEKSDLQTVARTTGANLVLGGTMMREGDKVRVTWRVVDAATGREWRDLAEGSASDLFAVQDRVASDVAAALDFGTASTLAARVDPPASQREYLEALGLLRRYDQPESLKESIQILERLGDSPAVNAAIARAYLFRFDDERDAELAARGAEYAEKALRSDPQNLEANITLGALLRQTGRLDEATATYLRVLSHQPKNADALLGLAETYKAAGDFEKAETSYKRAIDLHPTYWANYNRLGAFYYANGRAKDAIPLFQKVTQLVPDNERGHNNLAAMYQSLGRYEDALAAYRQSIARKPTAQAHTNMGTALYYLGRFEESAAAFEKAIELEPTDCIYHRNLGDALRWIPGRRDDAVREHNTAIALCSKSIAVSPADPRTRTALATSLAKVGRHREARNAILRSLEIAPRNPSAAYEAAVIAYLAGSEDEAVARLEQVIRLGQNVNDILRDPEFAKLRESGRLDPVLQSVKP